MHHRSISVLFTLAIGALSAGCSSDPGNPTSSSSGASSGASSTGSGGGGGGSGTGGGAACSPGDVPCSDQAILELNLQKDVTKGLIDNMADGSGWATSVDATAGGAFAPTPESYTYAKFTDQGLTKVMISDEQSLDSMDWDIAFRRYVIRINSGNSGPGCVKAAKIATGEGSYDKVTAVPGNAMFGTDVYFDKSCALIDDMSGLPTSPATALHGYWQYQNCVQMTHAVYAIELPDGRTVKFTVVDYYTPAVQDECDSMGTIPMMNTGSGNFKVRWAFLQ